MQSISVAITKTQLQDLLNIFDSNKSLSSRLIEHNEVRQLRKFINLLQPCVLSEPQRVQLGLLVFFTSANTKITNFYNVDDNAQTQTQVLLDAIRKKLFPYFYKKILYALFLGDRNILSGRNALANFDALTQGGGEYAELIASGLASLARDGLLADNDQGQANREAIVQGGGQYAETISWSLRLLSRAGLLADDDQGKINRAALTQGGGQYAELITSGLRTLSNGPLLVGNQGQENYRALTHGGGQYAGSVALGLQRLVSFRLFFGEQAQTNRNALIQCGGRYAQAIAHGLVILEGADLLAGGQAQINYTSLTQGGGQHAAVIAAGLKILEAADLLVGDQAQANRDALTQGGGQYAAVIAAGLKVLAAADLLVGDQAQANRDTLTQDGGQYAAAIVNGVECLLAAELLENSQAQANYKALVNRIKITTDTKASPVFLLSLLHKMHRSNELNQVTFNQLMMPFASFTAEEDASFLAMLKRFSLVPETVSGISNYMLVDQIISLHERFSSSADNLSAKTNQLIHLLIPDYEALFNQYNEELEGWAGTADEQDEKLQHYIDKTQRLLESPSFREGMHDCKVKAQEIMSSGESLAVATKSLVSVIFHGATFAVNHSEISSNASAHAAASLQKTRGG